MMSLKRCASLFAVLFPLVACGDGLTPPPTPPDAGGPFPQPGQAILSLILFNSSDAERECTLYIERDGVKTVLHPMGLTRPGAKYEYRNVAIGPESGYHVAVTGGCIGGPRPPEGDQLSTVLFWVRDTMTCTVRYYEPVAVLMPCQPG